MRKNLNELGTLSGTFLQVLPLGFTLVSAYLNHSSFVKEPVAQTVFQSVRILRHLKATT